MPPIQGTKACSLATDLISFSSHCQPSISPTGLQAAAQDTRQPQQPGRYGGFPALLILVVLIISFSFRLLSYCFIQASKQQHKTLANPSSLGAMEAIQHRDFANGIISETVTLSDRTLRNIFRTPELFFAKIGLYVSGLAPLRNIAWLFEGSYLAVACSGTSRCRNISRTLLRRDWALRKLICRSQTTLTSSERRI